MDTSDPAPPTGGTAEPADPAVTDTGGPVYTGETVCNCPHDDCGCAPSGHGLVIDLSGSR